MQTILYFSALLHSVWLIFAARFCIGLAIGGEHLFFHYVVFFHFPILFQRENMFIGQMVVGCTYIMEMLLPEQRMFARAYFNWVSLAETQKFPPIIDLYFFPISGNFSYAAHDNLLLDAGMEKSVFCEFCIYFLNERYHSRVLYDTIFWGHSNLLHASSSRPRLHLPRIAHLATLQSILFIAYSLLIGCTLLLRAWLF